MNLAAVTAILGGAVKYGPTVLGFVAKHGDQALALWQAWRPTIVAHAPQAAGWLRTAADWIDAQAGNLPAQASILEGHAGTVIAAAKQATQVMASHAAQADPGLAGINAFVGNVVARIPALAELQPAGLRHVQDNAQAAIDFQSGGG